MGDAYFFEDYDFVLDFCWYLIYDEGFDLGIDEGFFTSAIFHVDDDIGFELVDLVDQNFHEEQSQFFTIGGTQPE